MELESVKDYLRVDFQDDDEIIKVMMEAAKGYIESAVGKYDDSNPRANMLYLAVIQDLYDNRMLTITEQQKKRTAYMFSSIILQLQLENESMEEECN